MEREGGGDALGPEGAGVFFLVQQLDFTYPHPGVVQIELLGIVDGVALDEPYVNEAYRALYQIMVP